MPRAKHTTYIYAIFGITLVLFVAGTAAVILMELRKIPGSFKENLNVELELRDSLNANAVSSLQKLLLEKPYVKKARYISKEEADEMMRKELGQDYKDVLAYNPLFAAFIVNLRENYADKAHFDTIRIELAKIPEVKDVRMQQQVLESLDRNVRTATIIGLIIAGALLIFSVSLIFNTIRLAMFSNRFTIKTMQLFGATRWFIIRPFLGRSLLNGFLSGLIACALIAGLLFYFNRILPELALQDDLITFAVLSAGLILFGICISFFSTLTAVFRYLRVRVENLY